MILGLSSPLSHSSAKEWGEKHASLGCKALVFPLSCKNSDDEINKYVQAAKDNNLVIAEVGIWKNVLAKDEKERKEAIDYSKDLIKAENPITEGNIKNLHGIILKGIDDSNNGRYRLENVRIVGANHIPPDYIKINELMEKLIINYKEWDSFHPIIKASLLHGELVKIHPFIDGNGRVSRLIMNLSLMKDGYLPMNNLLRKN